MPRPPVADGRIATTTTVADRVPRAADPSLIRAAITGGADSILKDALGKLAAVGQAVGGMFASDEVVKGTLASYTFEHMEIASYRILIAAAGELGETGAVEVFRRCLAEEEAMADWLSNHSTGITRQFLVRVAADQSASR